MRNITDSFSETPGMASWAAIAKLSSQKPQSVKLKNIDVFSAVAWDYSALLELHSSETRKSLSRKFSFWNVCIRAGFILRERQRLLKDSFIKENKIEVYICWNILTSEVFNKSRPTWILVSFSFYYFSSLILTFVHNSSFLLFLASHLP